MQELILPPQEHLQTPPTLSLSDAEKLDWITVKLVKLSFIVPFWVEILSLLLTHAGAGEQPWSSGQMQCSALGAGGGFRCLALGHLIRG